MTTIQKERLDESNAAYSTDEGRRLQELKWARETHVLLCDRFGIPADDESLAHLARRFMVPRWVRGGVSLGDALVLFDAVRALRPATIIEVGTAAGTSGAAMLIGLECAGAPLTRPSGEPVIQSFDNLRHCYFAEDRAVGDGAREMAPDLMSGYRVHAGEWSGSARGILDGCKAEFAFIDGYHLHPFPAIDLLILAPLLAPGAWVALHDVNLPAVAREHEERTGQRVDWSSIGPQALFEKWPHEKIACGKLCDNIGLIRMPKDRPLRRDDLAGVLGVPWEGEVPDHFSQFLHEE